MIMQKILSAVNKVKEKAQKGQSIVEYGILIAVVTGALITLKTQWNMSEQLTSLTNAVNTQVTNAANGLGGNGSSGNS